MHRDAVRRRAIAVTDLIGLWGAFVAMAVVMPLPRGLSSAGFLFAGFPLWIVLNKLLGLYDRDATVINRSTLDELPRVAHSIALGAGLLFLAAPLAPGFEIDREQILLFAGLALITVPAGRVAARAAVRRAYPPERCVIVGSGQVAALVASKLKQESIHGVEVIGIVDAPGDDGVHAGVAGLPLLGTIDEFDDVCRNYGVDRVVVAFSQASHEPLLDVIRTGKHGQLKVTVVPRLFEVFGHGVELDEVQGMTLLSLHSLSRSRSSLTLKRTIDLLGAGILLLMLAPLLAIIAVAVRLDAPGPTLFRQQRIGRGNRPFTMLKFRTMVRDAEALKENLMHLNEADGVMFKIADDPRITRIGRFLRRTSLDELPQLVNVLRGEMSLVGPRPLVADEDGHVIGWHRARLELTPGLTGPWQVMGRTDIPFEDMVRLDYLYVSEWSLWRDLKLLVRTIPVVLRQRGR